MKKVLVLVALLLLAALTVQPALAAEIGHKTSCDSFYGYEWGTTLDEIVTAEGSDNATRFGAFILYTDQAVLNKKCDVWFSFKDGYLDERNIFFSTEGVTDYYDLHNYIVSELRKKYGAPNVPYDSQGNPSKFDSSKYNEEIESGNFSPLDRWFFDDGSKIILTTYCTNDEVSINLLYISPPDDKL